MEECDHNWNLCVSWYDETRFLACLKCAATFVLDTEQAFWYASTGTPVPEANPNAWGVPGGQTAVVSPPVFVPNSW